MTVNDVFITLQNSSFQLGVVTGVVIVTAAMVFFFGLNLLTPKIRSEERFTGNAEWDQEYDPHAQVNTSDKRKESRRRGRQVQVDISKAEAGSEVWKGWVMDRSSGGLRLASDIAVPDGTKLCVRVSDQAEFMPWIEVEVRHCKPIPKGWELGCRFVKVPTWNILMSFG